MRLYVFSIRYKKLFDNDWQYINKLIKAKEIKDAINQLHTELKPKVFKFHIDNIYSEELKND